MSRFTVLIVVGVCLAVSGVLSSDEDIKACSATRGCPGTQQCCSPTTCCPQTGKCCWNGVYCCRGIFRWLAGETVPLHKESVPSVSGGL